MPLLVSITGYSTRTGEAVVVPTAVMLPYSLNAIAPAEIDFGPDPESKRKSAPRRSRNTISTSEATYSLQSTDCDPETAVIECDSSTSGGGWTSEVKLPSGYTYECMVAAGASGDTDGDGILQQCEV